MLLTVFLAIVFCAAMALMLISCVAFIQDNRFFASAPKEAREVLIQRENIHLDHGIFGSPDLDQSGKVSAWLQSKLVVPLLTSFTKNEKKEDKNPGKAQELFEMDDETADRFMGCFAKFSPESIKNEYYTDLLTRLKDDIHVEGTKIHFIYANKMGEKYLKRYKKYFRDPEIREFNMQHEQWLFGGEQYTAPVLKTIDEFMGLKAD